MKSLLIVLSCVLLSVAGHRKRCIINNVSFDCGDSSNSQGRDSSNSQDGPILDCEDEENKMKENKMKEYKPRPVKFEKEEKEKMGMWSKDRAEMWMKEDKERTGMWAMDGEREKMMDRERTGMWSKEKDIKTKKDTDGKIYMMSEPIVKFTSGAEKVGFFPKERTYTTKGGDLFLKVKPRRNEIQYDATYLDVNILPPKPEPYFYPVAGLDESPIYSWSPPAGTGYGYEYLSGMYGQDHAERSGHDHLPIPPRHTTTTTTTAPINQWYIVPEKGLWRMGLSKEGRRFIRREVAEYWYYVTLSELNETGYPLSKAFPVEDTKERRE